MPTPKAKPKPKSPAPAQKPAANKRRESTYPWQRPLALVVSGPPGVGKTDFCTNFPGAKVYYDPQEPGILDLIAARRIPKPEHDPVEIGDFNELVAVGDGAGALARSGVQTVVLDSATGFEKMCFEYHCDEYFDGDNGIEGFMSYNKGPKQAAKVDWAGRLLPSLDNLLSEGINVILIAHTQVKPYMNPLGADYDRFTPFLDKDTWQFTSRWAAGVLFYNYHFSMAQKAGGKEEKILRKGKAKEDSVSRMLFTEWSPAYDAKNRWGLEPWIDAGLCGADAFTNFVKAFPR
jgi:hypothetical protein